MKPPEPSSAWRLYGTLIVLMPVWVVFPWVAGGSYAYLLPLAQLCGIYAIGATGLTLLMGFTGQVSLGHAGYYAIGAYGVAVAAGVWHWPVPVAIGVALGAGGVLAWATGAVILRLRGHYLALATLCLGVIIAEIINRSTITGGAAGLFDLPEITLFGLARGPVGKYYLIWGVLWLVMVAMVHLTASPVGRALRAIHHDEEAAAAVGIRVFEVKLKVFIGSSVLAGLAGVLYALVYTPSYLGPEEFHLMLSVLFLTMVVVGGMSSVWGGVVGAVLLTSMHEVITLAGEKAGLTQIARFEQLIYGLVLVLMMIYCPRGLAPSLDRWIPHRLRRPP